jgi:hypothetical protein
MAHQYRQLVRIELDATSTPAVIEWRGARYVVAEVLSRWHLMDRWWDPERASDRHYWRLRTPDHQIFEVYFDLVPRVWMLDRVQD